MAAEADDQMGHAGPGQDEMEKRFRNMANASPVLLWMASSDGMCTFFNQTWLTFTGRTLDEEWGVGWAENVHFEDFERCMNTYVRAFNSRTSSRWSTGSGAHDGEYRWILDRGAPRYSWTALCRVHRLVHGHHGAPAAGGTAAGLRPGQGRISVGGVARAGYPLTRLRLQVETLLRFMRRQPRDNELMPQLETRVTAIDDQVLRLDRSGGNAAGRLGNRQGPLPLSPEPIDLSDLVQRIVTRLGQMAVKAACPVVVETPGPVHGVWDRGAPNRW